MVLAHRKLPSDFINLFKGVYHDACASFQHEGTFHKILDFRSGVLQGCPGSSVLFNNAIEPFLFQFNAVLGGGRHGIVRATADDIAFASWSTQFMSRPRLWLDSSLNRLNVI